jgi:mRNA-degrading endonuclease RelE of RelBE toxin-antitoxin system
MIFIETTMFSKHLNGYMDDQEYNDFQHYLMEDPKAGVLIQGTGGLRKVRWGIKNRGKSGGVRIIYYWQQSEEQIYLLTVYAKNEAVDLSANEKKMLKHMVEAW